MVLSTVVEHALVSIYHDDRKKIRMINREIKEKEKKERKKEEREM
jgi:hypothetical protein